MLRALHRFDGPVQFGFLHRFATSSLPEQLHRGRRQSRYGIAAVESYG